MRRPVDGDLPAVDPHRAAGPPALLEAVVGPVRGEAVGVGAEGVGPVDGLEGDVDPDAVAPKEMCELCSGSRWPKCIGPTRQSSKVISSGTGMLSIFSQIGSPISGPNAIPKVPAWPPVPVVVAAVQLTDGHAPSSLRL